MRFFIKIGIVSPSESSTKSKISQFDMSVTANQDIIWFDITMDETHFVDGGYGINQFCSVESSQIFPEIFFRSNIFNKTD